jgi:hypothetical protein
MAGRSSEVGGETMDSQPERSHSESVAGPIIEFADTALADPNAQTLARERTLAGSSITFSAAELIELPERDENGRPN